MAINRGVLGSQTGSMGGITASNWKGKNVYKQKVPANNNSNSQAQQVQRAKFAGLALFARLFGPAIRVGFKQEAVSMTEQNVFTSKNFGAVDYQQDTVLVDISALKISSGTVGELPLINMVVSPQAGQVTVTWNPAADGVSALPTDRVYLVASSDNGRRSGAVLGTALRSAGTAVIPMAGEEAFSSQTISVLAFAKRESGTGASPTTSMSDTYEE